MLLPSRALVRETTDKDFTTGRKRRVIGSGLIYQHQFTQADGRIVTCNKLRELPWAAAIERV